MKKATKTKSIRKPRVVKQNLNALAANNIKAGDPVAISVERDFKAGKNLPAVVEPKEITKDIVTESLIKNYMDNFGIASGLTAQEQMQFIEIAKAFQLNPFKREIYCVPYMANVKDDKGNWIKQKKLSIMTGYEVYLKRATRLNVLSGWNAKTEGTGENMKAIITIYRKDWQNPFTHEVDFKEYNQDNKMWKEKPKTMIKKVVTAQGFRFCFPDEMGGMPYTSDELPENMTQPEIKNVTPQITDVRTDVQPAKIEAEKKEEHDLSKVKIEKTINESINLIWGAQTVEHLIAIGEQNLNPLKKSLSKDQIKPISEAYKTRMNELIKIQGEQNGKEKK